MKVSVGDNDFTVSFSSVMADAAAAVVGAALEDASRELDDFTDRSFFVGG